MAYNALVDIFLAQSETGLALRVQLVDSAGSPVGTPITTGFVEFGKGIYQWYGPIPDGHVGSGRVETTAGDLKGAFPINPREVEYTDVKTSSRSSHTAADVWAAGTRTLTGFGTLVADVWAAVADSPGVTTLLARLTAARAGYLDILNGLVTAIWAGVADSPGVTTLLGRLTAARAGYLDTLNGLVAAIWAAVADSAGVTSLLARLTAGRAGNLDNLDASVSSRLATAGYTAPDNAGIAATGGRLAGITSLANWLRALARKSAPDATALAEINTGAGTYDATTDALQAIRDRGDTAWTTGSGLGTGANAVTITLQTPAAAPVPGQMVTVRNGAGTAVMAGPAPTGSNGEAPFNLDSGTYQILVATTPQYAPLAPQTLVVNTSPQPVIYVLTPVTVTAPGAPNVCRIVGYLRRPDGAGAAGVPITFQPVARNAVEVLGSFLQLNRTVTAVADSAGQFTADLVWSADMSPDIAAESRRYRVLCPDCALDARITVPSQALADLADLLP